MNQEASILAARIRTELTELGQVINRAQHLLAKAIAQDDNDYFDGIALNLHRFYTGAERLLEDIAQEIDGMVPTGREGHRNLLIQMSADVPATRPAVIGRSTRHCLDEYRGLRHVVRHLYTFNLKPARLRELVTELPHCYDALKQDLALFCDFLETLVTPEDPER